VFFERAAHAFSLPRRADSEPVKFQLVLLEHGATGHFPFHHQQKPMNEDTTTTFTSTDYASESIEVSEIFSQRSEEAIPLSLKVQRTVGWIFLLPFCTLLVGLMRYLRGYKIENLPEIRRQFKEITRAKTPLLICANHLTFIDSALMLWAMAPNSWYLFNYRFFSWNLPAGDFFKKKLIYRFIAYLTKCIFIHRDGTREHKNSIVDLCRHLLKRGEVVSVFPEGRRSRSGRFDVDQLTKGCGNLATTVPDCRVLCVYLRGNQQETFSNYPAKGSRFYMKMEVMTPVITKSGREAYAEVTEQIAGKIKRMEEVYFAVREVSA
jgi:1-acyl-sn-glycerol-3-phosphate acyltransferase